MRDDGKPRPEARPAGACYSELQEQGFVGSCVGLPCVIRDTNLFTEQSPYRSEAFMISTASQASPVGLIRTTSQFSPVPSCESEQLSSFSILTDVLRAALSG